MTTTLTETSAAPTPAPGNTPFPGMRVTQLRVIQSEWTKFRSLRSTLITLAVAVVLTIGLAALFCAVIASHWDQFGPERKLGFNATEASLRGVMLAQLALGVLGVLLISGEYATGMIRASLTVVPKRLPVLWAKMTVFGSVTAVTSVISTLIAFFVGQSLLASKHINVSFSHPSTPRMVFGAALYLLLVGLTGMAFGALLRNTAAGISALVALFFVIPPLFELLPADWATKTSPYLPSNAGDAFWQPVDSSLLSPLHGLLVMLAWTVFFVILAAVRLKRADA
jgi:ABC-type transport system involved in multi-copper enzyme maturation permease subunit